jgi:hypothetical protein
MEGAPHRYSAEELAWMGEHLTQMRQSVSGQRLVLQSLGIGFVLGLIAYSSGYLLKASATTEPFKLVADLLYALGWALWTGVVVALFVEVIPKVKQRQFKQALDAYEAALREQAQSRSAQTSRGDA